MDKYESGSKGDGRTGSFRRPLTNVATNDPDEVKIFLLQIVKHELEHAGFYKINSHSGSNQVVFATVLLCRDWVFLQSV